MITDITVKRKKRVCVWGAVSWKRRRRAHGLSCTPRLPHMHTRAHLHSCVLACQITVVLASSLLLVAEFLHELVEVLFGITEEHIRRLDIERGVVYTGVAARHRALHEQHVLCVPDLNDRHATQRAVGIVLGDLVHRVIGSDDHDDVRVLHLFIDFLHLEDHVVGHAGLGEQHVELPRHAAGDRVDAELDVLALALQHLHELSHSVLSLGHSETVARDDHDGLRHRHLVDDALRRGLTVLTGDLHGLASGSRRRAVASQDHVSQRAVHGDAHDV
mmetsp:Transcript_125277/g.304184  ORF Transcript_125277/g.304184 Transcript_125277/m.304184 type:complete len:274 (-) Transcript_125277:2640-3461(-)